MIVRRAERRYRAAGVLVSLLAIACGAAGKPVLPATPAPSALAPSAASPAASRPTATPAEDAQARFWATQICAAAQGFLDAFEYGEPYGVADEPYSVAERRAHAAALTPRVVEASRLVVQLSLVIRPVEAGALQYQRALADRFRELSLIYEDYGTAISAAGSLEEIADIDARTITAVGRVIASLHEAREALPRALRTALGMVSGCPPLT